MLVNYIKTSARNLKRNKLFSIINIVGLAIGMSVGLLLIAFMHDLLSYDKFHDKGKRIFRVTSHAKFKQGYQSSFATTSLKLHQLIKDKVSGVDEVTRLETEFSGDANVNGKVVPLTGMYGEPSIFNVFTFPLVKGDAISALREPYSIVLTETSSRKLFGAEDAFGKTIHLHDRDYHVTGVAKDIPFFSHVQFESLVSLNSREDRITNDPEATKWAKVWQRNYVYLLLPESASIDDVQAQLDAICKEENRRDDQAEVSATLLPLEDIMLGEELQNSIRPVMPGIVLLIVSALTFVVILSACFNYTNLSIARAMRRYKEVGLRKVIGAGNHHLGAQFLSEAILVSLVALVLSLGMFLIVRPQVMSIAPELMKMIKLEITWPMALMFVALAILVGVAAGSLPAFFFARVKIIEALRNASQVKAFKGLNPRRTLVLIQYTVTLIFITSTVIGYVQYKKILAFDLGFNTENILNISLQKNKPDELVNKLKALPEVSGVSQSRLLTSVGNAWGAFIKYKGVADSTLVLMNIVDEQYIPLHDYELIAGQNFITRPLTKDATSELIVNETTVKQLNLGGGDPARAIGEEVLLNNKRLTIVGVMKDFHYSKLDTHIEPVVFSYLTPDGFLTSDGRDGLVNVRLNTSDPVETMAKIEAVWKAVDPVHPFEAEFYDDAIAEAYHELSAMINVIGFLSFIAISIASLGLLGMVVFTTETRLKEISIRKVHGASAGNLVVLLSRGFVILLVGSAFVALPITWYLFEKVLLTKFPFHEPVGLFEVVVGFLVVLAIACVLIGSQTVKTAQRNPAEVLRS